MGLLWNKLKKGYGKGYDYRSRFEFEPMEVSQKTQAPIITIFLLTYITLHKYFIET